MTYNSFSKRLKQSAFALFILWSSIGVAQGDLQQVLVETYYVSDAQDATTSVGGTLPEGSVTYRIFVTLCEGCALKAIYGDANHPFNIESTENFFNNDDRGKTWGHAIQDNRLNENTVALDSWLSFGGATDEDWGIPKPLDTDGSFVGGSNHEDGLLVNVTSEMGLALTEADGLLTAAATEPGNFFVSGTDASTIFGIETIGNAFSSTTFRAQADAFSIPETGNTFCIAQLTTNGELSFNLNIEVLNADGNLVKYVSSNELLLDGEV
ncbi:MAG: hypothetical protein RL226_538, partial [Bacteroidota bacterium]